MPVRRQLRLQQEGSPHVLHLRHSGKRILGTFTITKAGAPPQEINIIFPEDISIQEVLSAWNRQEKKWEQLPREEARPGEPYIAIRVIRLKDWTIKWDVYHQNDCPYDGCTVVPRMPEKDEATT